jgi:hypothetical protein
VNAVLLGRDLLLGSRIAAAAERSGVTFSRCEMLEALPPPADVDLLLVDWADRQPAWGSRIVDWRGEVAAPPRVVLFGPHADLDAHAAARAAGLGPMWARSRLVSSLETLFS